MFQFYQQLDIKGDCFFEHVDDAKLPLSISFIDGLLMNLIKTEVMVFSSIENKLISL